MKFMKPRLHRKPSQPGYRHRAITFTISLVLPFTPLLIPAIASAQQQCTSGVPADTAAIETQASWVDTFRETTDFATGAGVKVAIIDTGISPHPRLPEIHPGPDLVPNAPGSSTEDCDGHGTIVASVLAARDTGDGIRGVAPDVELLSIRQTTAATQRDTEHQGSLATLIDAINAAVDAHADIINLSLVACIPRTLLVDTSALEHALARAEQANILVVAAAGNQSPQCSSDVQVFPAHFDTVIAVSAHNSHWEIADYALTSSERFVSATGVIAAATSFDSDAIIMGTGSIEDPQPFQGTSFATPVITGTAALLRQRFPHESAAAIRQRIYTSADDFTFAVNPARTLTATSTDPHKITQYYVPESVTRDRSSATQPAASAQSCTPLTLAALIIISVWGVIALIIRWLRHDHR
ncbi:MAG: S8 family serine peptidase [Corynebacterium sp.]|nr:S8 family serine peptidase [Corynebacterium sp.]